MKGQINPPLGDLISNTQISKIKEKIGEIQTQVQNDIKKELKDQNITMHLQIKETREITIFVKLLEAFLQVPPKQLMWRGLPES